MNLFILDRNPAIAASYYCDKHVIKIIVEATQMLSCAFQNGEAPYKHTHYNHPMNKWVRNSIWNYSWTIVHARALCMEYSSRYNKVHKCEQYLDFFNKNMDKINFPSHKATEWPRCFGEWKDKIPTTDNIVEDYRNYYRFAKSYFAKWNYSSKPEWYNV